VAGIERVADHPKLATGTFEKMEFKPRLLFPRFTKGKTQELIVMRLVIET